MLKILHHAPFILAAVAALGLGTACSSDDSGAGGNGGSGNIGPVSFKKDIIGLSSAPGSQFTMRKSCALSSSCHQSATPSKGNLWLGPANADADPSDADLKTIHDGLLAAAQVLSRRCRA